MADVPETFSPRPPTMGQALLPLIVLVGLLALSVRLYGDAASGGPNQLALLLAAMVAALVGIRNGLAWRDIQEAIVRAVAMATAAIFILLAVGSLIGAWMLCGTVPTLIDYGLRIMDASWFYPAACCLCAVVSLAIGSSWTTAGTIGVALIGVAQGLGLSPAITAGAVVSGSYFGDKMSPLSDTTNLAPAAAGSDLFAHIRHMLWTTLPAFVAAVVLYSVIGSGAEGAVELGDLQAAMRREFAIGPWLLVPLLVVLLLAVRGFPAFPAILIGALLGAVFAAVFQPDQAVRLAGDETLSRPMAVLSGAWRALFEGYRSETGVAAVDRLLSRGGMGSMLSTVWLIVSAMAFGGAMERAGLLERLIRSILAAARSTGSLISATLATSLTTNILAADQFIAIIIPGRIFRGEYARRGLAPVNLSRALEDAGTLTSALVPWNTCGAYMAATLGVATLDYAPYAFLNWLTPLVAAGFAYSGFKILRTEAPPAEITHRTVV